MGSLPLFHCYRHHLPCYCLISLRSQWITVDPNLGRLTTIADEMDRDGPFIC